MEYATVYIPLLSQTQHNGQKDQGQVTTCLLPPKKITLTQPQIASTKFDQISNYH